MTNKVFIYALSNEINDLLGTCSKVVEDTSEVFEALENGDLSLTIETAYQGDFEKLKQHANATVLKLKEVIELDIQEIVNLAKNGDLTARINTQGKTGFFATLSEGINDLSEECDVVFDNTAIVAKALAEGDLTRNIEGQYKGIYADVVGNINGSISQIATLVEAINNAAGVVSQSSVVIENNNLNLEGKAGEQSDSVMAALETMNVLTQQIIATANRAESANTMSTQASKVASDGGNVVEQLIVAMDAIVEASDKINSIVGLNKRDFVSDKFIGTECGC